MSYPVEIVVRKKDGEYRAGPASMIPTREGWEPIESFGSWYGCQMRYKPYQDAVCSAMATAILLNEENA